MAKRRGSGEGSIYQRADGVWAASLSLGYENGKRKRKVFYGKTRSEVATKLREAQSDLTRGQLVTDERRTVKDYLDWWVTEVAPDTVKPTTADQYKWMVNRYVIPQLGHERLVQLTPMHVKDMLSHMEGQGLSVSTRRQTRAILRRALKHAEQYGLVNRNVAALVDCPTGDPTRRGDPLSVTEAQLLIAAAAGTPLEALVTAALALGTRKGEISALHWSDIDFETGMVTIRRTLKRRTGHGLIENSTKNRGVRTIAMPKMVIAALRKHRASQAELRLAKGPVWVATDYVFTTEIGTPIDPRNLSREYDALIAKSGVRKRTFHDLRHSAGTIMRAQGVPIETISEVLGHSGIEVTADIYAASNDDLKRDAASAVDTAFGPG